MALRQRRSTWLKAASTCDPLELRGHLRTLAAPQLLAADGKVAELAIGNQIVFSTARGPTTPACGCACSRISRPAGTC